MSYSKTNWTNNSTPAINADNLNKIEQGIYDNDAAIASANTNIGTLTNLTTTEKSNLVGAINEVDSNTDINATNIGDLSDLETTTQTDIVSAINEVNSKSEIDNTYGTSQTKGYSQEYQNAHNVVVSATQPTNKSKVWLQHSKNLIDGEFELGSIDTTTGNDVANSNFNRTNNAYVKPNTTYTLNLNSTNSQIVAYYYSSNSFLSFEFTSNSSTYTFTTPTNCIAVRFRISGASVSAYYDIQLEEGSTATSYEPYVQDKEYILNANNNYEEFNSQNEKYSTNETKIGTWTDGKPLYRKVFIVNAKVPTNTATSVGSVTLLNLATYNIDEFFIDFNRLDNADKSVSYYNPFSAGTPRYFAISKVSGNVLANFYNAFSNENVTITFSALYTKTTD